MEKKELVLMLHDSIGMVIPGVTDNHGADWTREQDDYIIKRLQEGAQWNLLGLEAKIRKSGFAVEKRAKHIMEHKEEYAKLLKGCDVHHHKANSRNPSPKGYLPIGDWQRENVKGSKARAAFTFKPIQRVCAMPLAQQVKVNDAHNLIEKARHAQQVSKDKANGLTKKVLARYAKAAKASETKAIKTLKSRLAKLPKGKTIPINELGKKH